MRSILDVLNILPSDEELLTRNPQFNQVTEGMELKPRLQQELESTQFATFTDKAQLEEVVQHLVKDGFLHSEIYTFVAKGGSLLDHPGNLKESKMGEGLLFGVAIGVAAGAIFGWLTGLGFSTPFLTVPIPRFFSLVVGAVIWGFIGGIFGTLIGRSIPEYKESRYETNLPDGTILLVLKVFEPVRARLARSILHAHGAKLVKPEEIRKAA